MVYYGALRRNVNYPFRSLGYTVLTLLGPAWEDGRENGLRLFLAKNVLYCQGVYPSARQNYCFSRLTSLIFLFFIKTLYLDLYRIFKSIARQIGVYA